MRTIWVLGFVLVLHCLCAPRIRWAWHVKAWQISKQLTNCANHCSVKNQQWHSLECCVSVQVLWFNISEFLTVCTGAPNASGRSYDKHCICLKKGQSLKSGLKIQSDLWAVYATCPHNHVFLSFYFPSTHVCCPNLLLPAFFNPARTCTYVLNACMCE